MQNKHGAERDHAPADPFRRQDRFLQGGAAKESFRPSANDRRGIFAPLGEKLREIRRQHERIDYFEFDADEQEYQSDQKSIDSG